MSAAPEVTVVVPTRNRATFLPTCIRAALAQVDVSLEVLVVDDGSTDDTRAVLESLGDDRVRVLSLRERGGVSNARNAGIAAALGTWLAFLDDDDLWAPWKLRRQLDLGEATGAGFVYGAAVVRDETGAIVRYGIPPAPADLDEGLLVRNMIPGGCSNVIARTEIVRGLGGFDRRLAHLADRDLWIRLSHATTGAACPEIVVSYLEHSGNMKRQRDPDGIEELEYVLDKHRAAREARGVPASRRHGYRYFARAQLLSGRRVRAARIFASLAVHERRPSDLGRALGALVLGSTVSAARSRGRPPLRSLREKDIAWLRSRSPEEVEWLRALGLQSISDDSEGVRPVAPPTAIRQAS